MRHISFLTLFLVLLNFSIPTLAQNPNEPVIRIVEITNYDANNKPTSLNIYGSNFGASVSAVSVTLAGTPLTGIILNAAQNTEIISASIPSGNWLAGTYLLTVTNGNKSRSTDVTIGAQGAKGDTGATGPKGDIGLTGATGPQGLKGDIGQTGLTGQQGLPGTTGISEVYHAKGNRVFVNSSINSFLDGTGIPIKILSKSVPAGSYIINTRFLAFISTGVNRAICRLNTVIDSFNGSLDESHHDVPFKPENVFMQAVATFPTETTIYIHCFSNGASIENPVITAIKVDAIR